MTTTMTARLVRIYQSAPQEVRYAGKTWYASARAEARSMAREHGTTEAVAAGVIAALSLLGFIGSVTYTLLVSC